VPSPLVRLRPLQPSDAGVVFSWTEDVEFCSANGWRAGLTGPQIEVWLADSVGGGRSTLLRLGVESDRTLVGYVDLAHLNATSAEFGIAIGVSSRWGRGIGTAAGELLLRHAFDELRLRRIDAVVPVANERSLRLVDRLGFRRVTTETAGALYRGALVPTIAFAAHNPTTAPT
jgi:RimJ/RimL family protein N-acetyltransferase